MITYHVEHFAAVEPEIRRLVDRHWQEVRDFDDVPLAVKWERFRIMAADDAVLVVTARDGKKLVGYIVHLVVESMHYDLLVAHDDAHYLHPDHRKGWTGIRLIRACEAALKARGVDLIYYHQKIRSDLNKGKVFERMGYAATEILYAKRI